MPATNIHIGIIGAGNNTRTMHIPKLQAIDGVKIMTVCNRSIESSTKVADEFSIPRIARNWREIIDDPGIDAVVIGTWPYLHHPITCAALQAGKHVLCEARMAMNAREAHEMLRFSRQNPHLICQVVPAPFTFPVDITLKHLMNEDFCGELYAINLRFNSNQFVNEFDPLSWRLDRAYSGYNTMMLGILYESLSRWVGHATAVMAMGKVSIPLRYNPENKQREAVHIPDHLNVLAEMACGAQAHFQFSSVTGLIKPTQEIWLFGRKGTIHVDLEQKLVYVGDLNNNYLGEFTHNSEEVSTWRVEEEFINAIRGKEKIRLTTFEEGVCYMEFTEAVTRSMATGRKVSLPLL